MNNKKALQALTYLYRIVEAGEKGYAVAAANMDNMGVKILFKSYAQQRAIFKSEILAEIMIRGGNANLRSSIRGVIHRGRIDIFAALSAGKKERERVVLKEVLLGESAALRAFQKTLKVELPDETRKVIVNQYEELMHVNERVRLLLGFGGSHLIARLFDNQAEMENALNILEESGNELKSIESIKVSDSLELYEERSSTVFETVASGAVGGALWGSLIGALAATSAESATHLVTFGKIQSPGIWLLIVLAGILGGTFVGMAIGYAIGIGIKQEDAHQYNLSKEKSGQVLLLTLVEFSQVSEVQRILNLITLNPAVRIEKMMV